MKNLKQKTFTFLFFLLLHCFTLALCLRGDSEILVRVKNARLDDPNGSLNDWVSNGESNSCNWTGVTCDSQNHSIISIDLSGLAIYGGFPYDFCRIRTLQNLSLGNSFFNGTLSSQPLSLCSHLRLLNLTLNYFAGEVPEFSPDFTELEVLDLSANNFTGNIPVSFGRFQALRVLSLSNNLLSGSIPSFLCNLSELTSFDLAYNPFKPGPLPPEIGNLTKLEILFLAGSHLVGHIPDSIGKLVALKNLDLSSNSLSGEIPSSIGGLKRVEQLELYDNQLSGGLPESIGNLSSLLRIDVSQNILTGKLPEKIAAMPLDSLNLNDNFFEGEVPEVLASNAYLQQLKLFNNSFSGRLPENLGNNSDLLEFDVSTNNFNGELPKYLCERKKLQILIAFNNRFSGSLPESYGECDSLNYVRIKNNQLSGEVPDGFWSLSQLSFLEMQDNRLEGSVSPSISRARGLTTILISGNEFTGGIPANICELHNLSVIDVSGNHFSGELPTCITGLKKLLNLRMQDNSFSGEIPSSVDSWTELNELNLSRNRFFGTIPPGLGDLPVLKYLDLSGNSLTGEIPAEITKLKLNLFNVSNNKLYGKVPLGFDSELYLSSLLGNPGLCSPYLKPLPRCSSPRPRHNTWYLAVVLTLCVVLLLGSLFWFFKPKYLAFGRKPKRAWKVVSFQRVGLIEEDILLSLKEDNLIGAGGTGRVYKVKLTTGEIVAVKRLWGDTQNPDSKVVFKSEVESLGRIRHRNVLRLLSSCSGDDRRILVFEYMENGSLGDVLHGEKGGGLLDWPRRFTIALGAAQGLAYLHHDCSPAIVHRDVKSNNILLDEEWMPRVADFGLAKTLKRDVGEGPGAMSRVAGSCGYIAPEIALSPPAEGSDNGIGCCGDLDQLIDPRMDPSSSNYEEIEKVLDVALLCTSAFPINRPSMRKVVELLKDNKLSSKIILQ
ncbi:hypothetical protein FH972_006804 [Carpinus fangiana]|uniref:non-specific serine/threonine protein kinase n=1 Tax=Carpinus fangiana TaxID=176857 RepID=A0A5N6QWD7_9ROSI|nr:hypothetical protein FH972_006804 [Carpinus fangiana]